MIFSNFATRKPKYVIEVFKIQIIRIVIKIKVLV